MTSRISITYALLAVSLTLALNGCNGSSSSSGTTAVVLPPVNVATTTALTVSPNPAPAGSTVTLTATVTAVTATPTGNVSFVDGTTTLGTVALASGVASLQVATFAAGSSHSLDASYAGATGFAASTSPAASLLVQAALPVVNITSTAGFSFTNPNQTIAGFGGAEAFYGNYLDSHPNQAAIYKALFDPTAGLGLTFLRVQNLYYQFTGSNATSFDLDTPKIVAAANAAAGTAGPLKIEMSAWSPPAAIKSNGSVNNGGTLNTLSGGGYNYAGYAQFWYNSLAAYAALGVVPNYISLQNELDFTATYASCRFDPTEDATYAGYDKALAAVYTQIQALPSPPKIIGPESFSTVNLLNYGSVLAGEPLQSSELAGLAHHVYNVSSTSSNPDSGLTALQNMATAYPTQQKWMTEYYDQPGFNTAWTIHNSLAIGNDNAYFYWGMAWPSGPSAVASGQATDQQGLIYIDNPGSSQTTWAFTSGWAYNDAYYAFKHFSYYVKPGYVRYNATITNTDERVSVYQSANGKTTVIVVMNVSPTVTDGLQLNLGNIPYTGSTVIRSTFSQPITTGERWNNLGAWPTSGLSLPPQSVATIIFTN